MNENDGSDGSSTNSELGSFDDFEDPAKDPEGTEQPGHGDAGTPAPVNVPELRKRSEYDRTIRPGSPVKDLWGGSWLIAVEKKADTVREFDRQQPDTKQSLLAYEGSIGTGATEEDAVWACFYLNGNNTLAGGRKGPYDFPESRICRFAYEATDGYKKGRFQDRIRMQVLEQVMAASMVSGELDPEQARLLISTAFTPELADEAFELAEASLGDR